MATRSPSTWRACRLQTASMQYRVPRAVASTRPSEPPTESGLPVTTPSTE
jgi:hypothetical protein